MGGGFFFCVISGKRIPCNIITDNLRPITSGTFNFFNNESKKIIIGLAIVIFLFSGLTGYAYYVGNATFPEANVIEKIQYGFQGIKMDISNQA